MLTERQIELTPEDRRPLAGPFPNLRTREIVRNTVIKIVETLDFVRFSPPEAEAFALGYVRGAFDTVQAGDAPDVVTAMFLADLLDRLNRGGSKAIRELIEVVTGRVVPVAANANQPAQPEAA